MATEGTRLLSRWTAQRPRCVYTLQRKTRSTTLSCPIAGITIWFFLEPSSTNSHAITLPGYALFHLPVTPRRIERPDLRLWKLCENMKNPRKWPDPTNSADEKGRAADLHLQRDDGKDSHRNFSHPRGVRITISGSLGSDAKRYQEKAVKAAIAKVSE